MWTVPPSSLRNTVNELCLDWSYAVSPRTALGGDRMIGATGVALPVDVELKSFADGAWISTFDEETGAPTDASAGRRGVNVTVLNAQTGEIVDRQGFDTAANEFESEALAAYIEQIAAGSPVLLASRGAAGDFLTEEAITQLRTLGADTTLASVQGSYFSIVGVKGAQPGTALQAVDAAEAYLWIGLNPDRRTLAAAVGTVRVTR
ncbi:MAG: interleukin-like EMT inducer domain-containing protein [Caldilineaceae bacterium]